jgi:hypothetical protein
LAVQSPAHFDLSYRKDWKGMKFGHLLNNFKGPLRLMHGSDSGVCTAQQVKELQREFPEAKVFEVAGAAHPVPFNAAVNQFVLTSLDLPAASTAKAKPPKAYEQMNMVLEDAPVWKEPTVVTDAPVEVMRSVEWIAPSAPTQMPSESPVELPDVVAQPSLPQLPSLWPWLKRRLLGATKK